MKNIVLMASGSGSNAENIICFFRDKNILCNFHIITNKKDAFVLERAKKLNVPAEVITKKQNEEGVLLDRINELKPDLIVLAGYLLLFPAEIVALYPNKIINIHPALLPKFGGKGMYGSFVHEAVVAHKESETGITIHYVSEHYDEGAVIFQAKTPVVVTDTPLDIANKVHKLEYEHFPKVIEKLLND
ncbi:phosphoribosylglycinamide formyltransferase [Paenimyroides aestuarii]|uniref:Phosphoribosylglycinamide formyltransferase n=1 Tax=Paenimyroides aestuarii TaxID=2968490 RepID=A0ABY5NVJ7_9FLAO|nr:phosphoribosylglycinamide formyltransferase [Paenimyroides aestuarii]UUV22612.1 phosphoribosylglycinamide formyltransferase [Paenimyroides aestuarii]